MNMHKLNMNKNVYSIYPHHTTPTVVIYGVIKKYS